MDDACPEIGITTRKLRNVERETRNTKVEVKRMRKKCITIKPRGIPNNLFIFIIMLSYVNIYGIPLDKH